VYVQALAEKLVQSTIPAKPQKWVKRAGWVRYDASGKATSVAFPDDDVLVFDVEVLVPEGNYPTMATAVSDTCW